MRDPGRILLLKLIELYTWVECSSGICIVFVIFKNHTKMYTLKGTLQSNHLKVTYNSTLMDGSRITETILSPGWKIIEPCLSLLRLCMVTPQRHYSSKLLTSCSKTEWVLLIPKVQSQIGESFTYSTEEMPAEQNAQHHHPSKSYFITQRNKVMSHRAKSYEGMKE